MTAGEVKEVQMDVAQEGGGGGTRKRRGGRRRRTRAAAEVQEGGAEVGVERVEAPAPAPVGKELAPVQTGGARAAPPAAKKLAAPVVVIAPAKKKPAKVMLVPKSTAPRPVAKKTFKARKVRVTMDNTTKTVKRRRSVLGRIDTMTDEQVRAKAVAIKLSRPETVAKAPAALLRQMVKDYYTMRGSFL
jgi:hypothetical protein